MWERHAIQVKSVNNLVLYIESNTSIESTDSGEFMMQSSRTDFDSEDSTIAVKIAVMIGYDESGSRVDSADFWLKVDIEGVFSVDTSKFPIDKIDVWAEQNAPLILYPYAREAAMTLTSRVLKHGAALFPLLTVPTIKV